MVRFWVLIISAVAVAAQTDLPTELTLSKALELALTNSAMIHNAMAELSQASGRTEQSRSPLLPQIGVAARQGYLTLNLPGFGI